MTENLVLNFDEWNINLTDRTRNRMKLQIKLGKDEALAFKNFMEMVKPPEIAESDFLKGIFKIGVDISSDLISSLPFPESFLRLIVASAPALFFFSIAVLAII